jgi:hypothetical protein
MEDVDDTYAALALMYGYAARYAPSTVIEARINALVVHIQLMNMFFIYAFHADCELSKYLHPNRCM